MARSMTLDQKSEMHSLLFKNHKEFFSENIQILFEEYYRLAQLSGNTIGSLLKEKIQHPLKTIRRRFFTKKPLI